MKIEKEIAKKIRDQYVEKEDNKLDELRRLDRKVKNPAEISAFTIGTAGALILGTGMSLAMKVIGNSFAAGVVIGCVGLIIVSVNYLVYKKILASRKKKYSSQIIDVSNALINE